MTVPAGRARPPTVEQGPDEQGDDQQRADVLDGRLCGARAELGPHEPKLGPRPSPMGDAPCQCRAGISHISAATG